MAIFILIAFIAVPLIEIAVFIEVGGWIGLWPTLAIIILTALVGTWLLRLQGLATLGKAQSAMERGEVPMRAVFDGACLLVAGALLLTPGFVTDALGGLLFLPSFRSLVLALLARRLTLHMERHGSHPRRRKDGVIDGEWEEVNEWPEIDADKDGDTHERD